MNRSRWIIAIGVVFVALVALGPTAGAQDGPTVTLSPASGLADGDTVTVTMTGFPADSVAFSAVQCVITAEGDLVPSTDCDLDNSRAVTFDAEGAATIEFVVHEGAIGSGTCGEGADQCIIGVGSIITDETAGELIFFGADSPAAEEPAAEELAVTGPRGIGISLVAGLAILAAGSMIISTSRRRFLA